jgi:hypothetical protein
MKFAIGFVLGIVVGQVGFAGVARMLDRGVDVIQQQAQEATKKH